MAGNGRKLKGVCATLRRTGRGQGRLVGRREQNAGSLEDDEWKGREATRGEELVRCLLRSLSLPDPRYSSFTWSGPSRPPPPFWEDAKERLQCPKTEVFII